MESVSFAPDDRGVRRVRSVGDVPTDNDMPTRPARIHIEGARRRSEGQTPRTATFRWDQSRTPSGPVPPPSLDNVTQPSTRAYPYDFSGPIQVEARPNPAPRRPAERSGCVGVVMTFLGYTGPDARARRELLSLIWTLFFNFAQFVIVITLLAYAAHRRSPTEPESNEWDACDKPLGAWNAIWVVRVVFSAILAYWTWQRDRATNEAIQQQENRHDPENGRPDNLPPVTFPSSPLANGPSRQSRMGATPNTEQIQVHLPHSHLFQRLNHLTSLLSLVWFLTAHVLAYTSVNSCRHSSPHLWWLTFGILCILYLMVLEIFILGLLVFILGPMVYLTYNLILLCLGRHPLQNPHYIKPEIGKLPKSVVDQIPLVLYIPAPPDEEEFKSDSKPITVPPAAYTYPPTPSSPAAPRKRRFAFLRRSKKEEKTSSNDGIKNGKGKAEAIGDEPRTWEDNWEPGEYPFVRLEGNRATCAICLMDFEEPKRIHGKGKAEADKETQVTDTAPAPIRPDEDGIQEVQVDEITSEDIDRLQLQDAGEGAQPLRLLGCGHVFHQTCIDPWLTDVSGRCPVCQRAVELPKPPSTKRRNTSRTNSNSSPLRTPQ